MFYSLVCIHHYVMLRDGYEFKPMVHNTYTCELPTTCNVELKKCCLFDQI